MNTNSADVPNIEISVFLKPAHNKADISILLVSIRQYF